MNNSKIVLDNKYAEFVINFCLNGYLNRKLLIELDNSEVLEFANILKEYATKAGMQVEILYADNEEKMEYLRTTDINDLEINIYNDRTKWSEYALNQDVVLHIKTFDPTKYDISAEKMDRFTEIASGTREGYSSNNTKYNFPWLIIGYPNTKWANLLFPNNTNAFMMLYQNIIESCMLNVDDPYKAWDNFIDKSNRIKNSLNERLYQSFIINNDQGTNLELGMLDKYQFLNLDKRSTIGKRLIVNFPSYEIFTAPNRNLTNGIVYNTRPLVVDNQIIDDFYLVFKDGIVVDYDCGIGKKYLESILKTEGANRLGEFAMVEHDSPISKTNLIYYNTLFDENSSCHLALGKGYQKCSLVENDVNLNFSSKHNDFMIGDSSTDIFGVKDGKKELIYKKGKFII